MLSRALLRYNFRVLMFHNWWLLVIPLAVSQLTVFWTASTEQFAPQLPANIVERVSPLLAAFLCAHILSSEYRSGIGAVLACKPVHLGKIVFMRLAIAILLTWALGFLSLAAFYFGMEPYPFVAPAIAMMTSSLFLALFALTFATLFRHPLTGFGIAALYWALDLPVGPPMNPYLSLKSLSSSFPLPGQTLDYSLTGDWWVAKILLFVAAITLYLLHNRLLFTLGSPLTLRRRRKALGWAAGVLAVYIVSGATLKVGYGYSNRGKLFPSDIVWFRRQFAPYSPIPVAMLFGPNFRRYLGDIPSTWRIQLDGEADLMGDSTPHRQSLRRVVEAAPNSLWAAGSADAMARLSTRSNVPLDEKLAYNRLLVEKYPNSPYTLTAMQQIGRIYAEAKKGPEARAAYEALLARNPGDQYTGEAFRFLAENDRQNGQLEAAATQAQRWIAVAPVHEKFAAWLLMAEIQTEAKKKDEAKQAAKETIKAVAAFREASRQFKVPLSETKRLRVEQDAITADARARQIQEPK